MNWYKKAMALDPGAWETEPDPARLGTDQHASAELIALEEKGISQGYNKGIRYRGNMPDEELGITKYRPAIYFSDSSVAGYFATAEGPERKPEAYFVKANNTASPEILRDLVKQKLQTIPEYQEAEINLQKMNTLIDQHGIKSIDLNQYETILDSIRDILSPFNKHRRTASHLTIEEVELLQKAGYDSLEGPIDGIPGTELAVFSLSQLKRVPVENYELV